jgi:hypothetical protein
LDLVSILVYTFSVALQVDNFLTTLAEVVFLGALGAGIIAIMIAPFIKMFRNSDTNKNPQRKFNPLEINAIEDAEEECFEINNDSASPTDFVNYEAS